MYQLFLTQQNVPCVTMQNVKVALKRQHTADNIPYVFADRALVHTMLCKPSISSCSLKH